MNFLQRSHQIAVNSAKYLRVAVQTSSHVVYIQTKTSNEDHVIANIRDKLCCTEDIARNIYSKFPSLQTTTAIKNDSLKLLRSKIAEQSIIENPSLVTMNRGEFAECNLLKCVIYFQIATPTESLKEKINLLMELEPKSLDDFAPLLTLDEKQLQTLVRLLAKDNQEIKQNNRIYYLSEKLKVNESKFRPERLF